MFKNVLVGVDGRPNGRDAIALAARLTDPDGKLTLAHVHSGELRPVHAVTPGLLAEERDASAKLLEQERADANVKAELLSIVAMSPGGGLHQQADEQQADLLVVGSCSRGAFGRAMLGDDTRGALNGAPCAVAIAARGYAEHPTPIARIGVGYDGSPESRAALAAAQSLAAPTRAAVSALEVVSIPTYAYTGLMPPAIGESIDEMLKEANGRMRALAGVEGHAVYGLTGEELAAFGDELDILVVGSRSYGPVRRMMLGSTSDYLERHARCSLLVLPRVAAAGTAGASAGDDGLGAETSVSATA
jgi:nucleotide-binding universal stress UspA family protein